MVVETKKKKHDISKARFIRAANYTKELYVSDPSWGDKLINAICWLVSARAEYVAKERGLSAKDLVPFSPGWALRLPDGGSFIVTMPSPVLGAKVSALPDTAKPVEMEIFAVATYAATLTAGTLADAYEAGAVRSAWFYAVDASRGCWLQADLPSLLRSTAEEVIRAGGPVKAYKNECRGEGDMDVLRLFKKAVSLYRRGLV